MTEQKKRLNEILKVWSKKDLWDQGQNKNRIIAELRTRLEKAVELPVKVGDTVYDIYSDEISESKIKSISLVIYKDSICWSIHYVQDGRTLYFSDTTYNSLWFTDRTKAEVRLAELKGGEGE